MRYREEAASASFLRYVTLTDKMISGSIFLYLKR